MPEVVALLQEKLFTVILDVVGSDGGRDSMFHFGFLLKGMMVDYERRMNEVHAQHRTNSAAKNILQV